MRPISRIALFAASSLVLVPGVRADVVTEWDQLATNAIVADIPTNVYAVNNPSAPVTNPSALGIAGSNINPNAATRDLAIESIAVYGGVHFQYSIDAANAVGADVANYVVANEVVPEPASISTLGPASLLLLRQRRRRS